jgi:hypothetical protein
MDFLNKVFEGKDITESSKNLYMKNLIRLGGEELKSLAFLKDTEKINEKLSKYKPNTKRCYIISIVSALKSSLTSEPKNKKLFEKYSEMMDTMNTDLKSNNVANEKEQENWIPKNEIEERKNNLLTDVLTFKKKITEEQFFELQKLLLLSLYTDQRPRRNVDYQNMYIVKHESKELPKDKNYLFLDSNKFQFNNFKTAKSKGSQEEVITPELKKVLDIYLKYHPLSKSIKSKEVLAVPFIVNFKGEVYTNGNDMTRLLYKIFNKKVGSSQFRKMFLTDKYSKVMEEMKEDTNAMGTSTNMAENQYIKNNV